MEVGTLLMRVFAALGVVSLISMLIIGFSKMRLRKKIIISSILAIIILLSAYIAISIKMTLHIYY